MTAGAFEGDPGSGVNCNAVAYDEHSGEILLCALLRPNRIANFPLPGKVMFLWDPQVVRPEVERVNPASLTLEPRPISPIAGQTGIAPLSVDLSWCPAGAQLFLQNEDGETLEGVLPLVGGLTFTDPGRYSVTLRGAFPYQDFIGEIEVVHA